MTTKKKIKRITKIKIIFLTLFSISLISCFICFGVYLSTKLSLKRISVNIEPETYKISILSDEDISDVYLKFNVSTEEYGDKVETIVFDELKGYKVVTSELEMVNNKEIKVVDVQYDSASTSFADIFKNITMILIIPTIIFAVIFLALTLKGVI